MSDYLDKLLVQRAMEVKSLQAEVKQQAMRIKVLTKTVNMQADALDAVRALPENWRTTPLGNVIAQHCASVCADELEAKLKETGDE